ncbi:hypothetical protein D2E26_0032 [Bifidobacterium dolichotidis]|uniref:Uncharacterized protein n=1 Tax=Bifidobacterium dolichotidis TaxID=2306976 RepID=A0A430FRH4_9BIFI|nr:hypothetical protein [Bifidobacterium dolichotidis]RSX55469.1 hypothetical protein D2E26_0032 [Bifidobacterium dolichotidis]
MVTTYSTSKTSKFSSCKHTVQTIGLRGIAVLASCCFAAGILPASANATTNALSNQATTFTPEYTEYGCVKKLKSGARRTTSQQLHYKVCMASKKVLDEYKEGWHVMSWSVDTTADKVPEQDIDWLKVTPTMDISVGSASGSSVVLAYGTCPGCAYNQVFSGKVNDNSTVSTTSTEIPVTPPDHYELPITSGFITVKVQLQDDKDLVELTQVRTKLRIHVKKANWPTNRWTTQVHSAEL